MKLKVSTAVALTLSAAASPAFAALDLQGAGDAHTGYQAVIVLAGASAARSAIENLVKSPVVSSSWREYRGSDSDFRAFSIVASSNANWGALAGKNIAIYYRSRGGSAWGPVSVALQRRIQRLDASTCPANTTDGTFVTCTITGHDRQSDTVTSGLVKAYTDVGVADQEPKVYAGANWPGHRFFSYVPNDQRQPAVTAISAGALPVFGQVFGITVNKSGIPYFQQDWNGNGTPDEPTDFPPLSRAAVAGIWNGTYSDWSEVPTPGGDPVSATSKPIKLVRREQGSGTQVGAHQYFIGISQCTSGASPSNGNFATGTFVTSVATANAVLDLSGRRVVETDSSSTLNDILNVRPNGIGLVVADKLPSSGAAAGEPNADIKYLAIDGVGPSRTAAATGEYPFWWELTFTKRGAIPAKPATTYLNENQNGTGPQLSEPALAAVSALSTNQNLAIDALTAFAHEQATASKTISVVALPGDINYPYGQGPHSDNPADAPPIAYASREANTCGPLRAVAP